MTRARLFTGTNDSIRNLVIENYDPWTIFSGGQRHREISTRLGYLCSPPVPLFLSAHAALAQRIAASMRATPGGSKTELVPSFDIVKDAHRPPLPATALQPPLVGVVAEAQINSIFTNIPRRNKDSVVWPDPPLPLPTPPAPTQPAPQPNGKRRSIVLSESPAPTPSIQPESLSKRISTRLRRWSSGKQDKPRPKSGMLSGRPQLGSELDFETEPQQSIRYPCFSAPSALL